MPQRRSEPPAARPRRVPSGPGAEPPVPRPARALCLLLVLGLIAVPEIMAGENPVPSSPRSAVQDAFEKGDFETAALLSAAAVQSAQQAGREKEALAALLDSSEAYSALGRYEEALDSARRAQRRAAALADARLERRALARVGDAERYMGSSDAARRDLTRSAAEARQANDPALAAVAMNSLGNLEAAQGRWADARTAYAESVTLARRARRHAVAARALTNLALVALEQQQPDEAHRLLDRALDETRRLPPSHARADGLVRLGRAFERLAGQLAAERSSSTLRAVQLFEEAGGVAGAIGDRRASSAAWGFDGRLYEKQGQSEAALALTRRAVFAAQQVDVPELLYQWEWQTGRLLEAQGDLDGALAACRRAVRTAQPIRRDLVRRAAAGGAAFEDTIGAVFLDLVDLLLRRAASLPDSAEQQPYLQEARETMESLKVAELQNYFQDDCVDASRNRPSRLEDISPTAAVIYPIALPDRLELLVSQSTGIRELSVPVTRKRLTEEIRAFRRLLEKRTTFEFLRPARQLYDWLIRPLAAELTTAKIDTLVFVPYGPLGTIPMAALNDGQHFLIERYAVAITPALDLTDPHPLAHDDVRLLIAGLTEAVQGYPALASVAQETRAIHQMYGGTLLLNDAFEIPRLQKAMEREPFTVVHIASHGEFQGQVARTFLLTFDGRLTMNRLDQLVGLFRYRDEPLELLTLSACQTAAGDDRAALGLAGVAVKAGAKSALATLWFIDDEAAADLVEAFYRQLRDPGVSKAVALQRAQLSLLEDRRYRHPAYWAPYLLINNWL